jgi:hypothetical protein
VLDSDYHTPVQIQQRLESAQRHSVELHIWSKKEIENYLIVPTAIQRIIQCASESEHPTVEEVSAKIEQITDGLREECFDAMANDFYLEERASGIAAANQKARQRMETAWQTLRGRLTVVSGKRMLSSLSDWAKNSFGVSFGAARIAQALRVNEIDPEIRGVIDAIENNLALPPS